MSLLDLGIIVLLEVKIIHKTVHNMKSLGYVSAQIKKCETVKYSRINSSLSALQLSLESHFFNLCIRMMSML